MDISLIFRAGTKIAYQRSDNDKYVEFKDICLVYPDVRNDNYYIALSKKTSKASLGTTPEDAYINLIMAIIVTARYLIKEKIIAEIGIPSTKDIWDESALDSVHRIEPTKQTQLLGKIYEKLGIERPPLTDIDSLYENNNVSADEYDLSETLVLEPIK